LAIGKEGQNTRLAARLTGWRLDIKGMTEWEQIREARLQAAAEAAAKAAAEAALLAAAQSESEDEKTADVSEGDREAEAAVAEAVAIVEGTDQIPAAPETADAEEQEVVAEVKVSDIDDDSILEALIREEEMLSEAETTETLSEQQDPEVGISVDDLDSFTLEDVAIIDEEDDEPDDEPLEFAELPVLTPDAGKIRFAEDIVDDTRGGGRRTGGGRRRGGGGGGSRRR
jgi:hypothetical protein